MLELIKTDNILFLDIETVPQQQEYKKLNKAEQALWNNKAKFIVKESETPTDVYHRAGIYAEFGKIICISVGFIQKKKNSTHFRVKSFFGHDEKLLLADFIALLNTSFGKTTHQLCAHNGKEFDFPYLSRRILINGLKLPRLLNNSGKKPWEVPHLDTMELWRFGDYKSYTSLDLLAHIFDIPTPKQDMDGSKVYEVYYKEKNLDRIVTYCQKDVITIARLLLKMKGEESIADDNITYV